MGNKILLADDSITIQKVIELTFSDEDFEVVTVGNGRLAIEKAQDIRPDVVLCDIIMPEKDGYEVCDYIKKTPGLSHVPVLLLTGAFEPFDQERAARVGCDGFLAKPFEPQTLIAKVKDLLSQAATRQPAPAPARPAAPPHAPAPPVPPPPAFVAPPMAEPEPEPSVTFIPEEPVVEEPPPASFADALEMAEPAAAPGYDEPSVLDRELYGGAGFEAATDELVATPAEFSTATGELMDVTPEESATLSAPSAEWGSQATMEVPLEDRAQASVEAAHGDVEAPVFDEVFEEELKPSIPAPPPAVPTLSPPPPAAAPPPAAPQAARVAAFAPPPPPAPSSPALREEEASFAAVAPPAPEPPRTAQPSTAAQVAVPTDMVETIAQRVVAQISEKIVREIAWEVIPDLAEALIKKEIERLKAELQQT